VTTHELKCWPEHFAAIQRGAKTGELRLNDRAFAVGDLLVLREWSPALRAYTGVRCDALITHIVTGGVWLAPGYAMLSIRVMAHSTTRDFTCEECGKLTPFRANGMCIACIEREMRMDALPMFAGGEDDDA